MRQPLIKEINQDCIDQVISTNPKYRKEWGFLHIPKTGGSSIMRFFESNYEAIKTMPVPLFHSWTLDLINNYFPSMKLIFAIRDPLERTISGYQSRLRMGTPEYYVPWRNKEAIAFCMYRSVPEFLDGLLDDSDYHISATTYLLDSVMAISWNYNYYFNSAADVEKLGHCIGTIAELSSLDKLISSLIDNGIIQLNAEADQCQIKQNLLKAHRSKNSSDSYLKHYSSEDIAKMKARLQDEYEIYDALKKYSMH